MIMDLSIFEHMKIVIYVSQNHGYNMSCKHMAVSSCKDKIMHGSEFES